MNLTNAEKLIFNSVRLIAFKNNVQISTGTGFYFCFARTGTTEVRAIVTNKHVVAGCDTMLAVINCGSSNPPNIRNNVTITIGPRSYVEHPNPNVDLCALIISEVAEKMNLAGTPIFAPFATLDDIPSDTEWGNFDAIEDIAMIGCPNGLYDATANLPIVRRGVTASPLANMYNGKNEFMVDMACFPGSSGSPVYLYNPFSYYDKKRKSTMMTSRIKLVGILYSGPQVTNSGQLILGSAPKIWVNSMMHLGNAIRSNELKTMDESIRKLVNSLDG